MIFEHFIATPIRFLRANLLIVSTCIILYLGWTQRDSNYLSAETGTGYVLGIVGSSLMIALLLYPLSKRVSLLTRFIPIQYWFGIHMFFGTVGPVLVLFHSNFHLGSTNSSIALICMLLVAGSGLVGRYIYTRIHHGLYGSRINIQELKQATQNNHTELINLYTRDETLSNRQKKMEEKALQPYTGFFTGLMNVIYMAINAPRIKRRVMHLLKDSYQESNNENTRPDSRAVKKSVINYTSALRKAAAFRVYERLFSLWHLLHLPLFFMMIITAIIHIFAVNMY